MEQKVERRYLLKMVHKKRSQTFIRDLFLGVEGDLNLISV